MSYWVLNKKLSKTKRVEIVGPTKKAVLQAYFRLVNNGNHKRGAWHKTAKPIKTGCRFSPFKK